MYEILIENGVEVPKYVVLNRALEEDAYSTEGGLLAYCNSTLLPR